MGLKISSSCISQNIKSNPQLFKIYLNVISVKAQTHPQIHSCEALRSMLSKKACSAGEIVVCYRPHLFQLFHEWDDR